MSNKNSEPLMNEAKRQEDEEASYIYAQSICSFSVFSMFLNAVLELQLFEIIAKSGQPFLSPQQIASHLSIQNPEAPLALDRMLQLLASYSLLVCSTRTLENGGSERVYGLSPAGKWFLPDSDGISMANIHDFTLLHSKDDVWYNLKEAISEGGIPFERTHKEPFYDYWNRERRHGEVFKKAMTAASRMIVKMVLKKYKGFENFNSLVDVGGNSGITLKMIISKYPSIKGINYDLPDVVEGLPQLPGKFHGITHIGGDMFHEVPQAEAIFMKQILHNWSDENCLRILKNCHAALPEAGKMIVVDHILPSDPQGSDEIAKKAFMVDMAMFCNFSGKERTEKEFRVLAKAAGFSGFKVVCSVADNWLMELTK